MLASGDSHRYDQGQRREAGSSLVDRNFYADAPNVLWVADITFVPTWAGFIYLGAVLDALSRRIVGRAIGYEEKSELDLQALNIAVTQRKPHDVIHHSDSRKMEPISGWCDSNTDRPSGSLVLQGTPV